MFNASKHEQIHHTHETLHEACDEYFRSAEGMMISAERVLQELKSHGTTDDDVELFFISYPAETEELYNAQDVLRFLGY